MGNALRQRAWNGDYWTGFFASPLAELRAMSARRWSAWGWALCVDINAPTRGVEGNPFRTMPCRKFHVQRMRGQRAWINDLLDECEDCLITLFASSDARTVHFAPQVVSVPTMVWPLGPKVSEECSDLTSGQSLSTPLGTNRYEAKQGVQAQGVQEKV